MRVKLAMAGFVGALALTVGSAEAGAMIEGFKPDVFGAAFKELGATELQQEAVQGDPRLTFKIGGIIHVVDFYRCNGKVKGCEMVQYVVAFDPDASDTVEAVNKYNNEFVFGKAALDKTDGLLSLRALLWTPSSTTEQIKAEFGAFVGATAALLDAMKAAPIASAKPAGPALLGAPLGHVGTTVPVSPKLRSVPRNRR